MTAGDLEVVQMRAAALFVHDTRLIAARNAPDPTDPASRFFPARTAVGNLRRTCFDLPADLAALERLAADAPHALGEHGLAGRSAQAPGGAVRRRLAYDVTCRLQTCATTPMIDAVSQHGVQ